CVSLQALNTLRTLRPLLPVANEFGAVYLSGIQRTAIVIVYSGIYLYSTNYAVRSGSFDCLNN
ncbi:MAG TPA: hypothetical protein VFJ67_05695, partial [Thermodesulfobacteriota bacterium]|nr:hypothetical protein [Thermodesulfobacteriota bacterium]